MNKKQQAQQLRLAADILETGHPWERHSNGARKWIKSELPVAMAVSHGDQIRPILATPPDNRPLHNPDNLTAEQVGLGYRLCLLADTCDQPFDYWLQSSKSWEKGVARSGTFNHDASPLFTYRLPLSTPWPEPKPEPETKTVELGPEDVPPMCAIKCLAILAIILCVCDDGVWVTGQYGRLYLVGWKQLLDEWQINRSIPLTGKWDANAWEPCHKTLANG